MWDDTKESEVNSFAGLSYRRLKSTDKTNFSVNDHNTPQNVALACSRSTRDATRDNRKKNVLRWDTTFGTYWIFFLWASLIAQLVKNLPAMQETQVQFLGQEDPLEKGNGSSLQYCLENPTDRGAWRATVHGVARVRHHWATKLLNFFYFILKEIEWIKTNIYWAISIYEQHPSLPCLSSRFLWISLSWNKN